MVRTSVTGRNWTAIKDLTNHQGRSAINTEFMQLSKRGKLAANSCRGRNRLEHYRFLNHIANQKGARVLRAK